MSSVFGYLDAIRGGSILGWAIDTKARDKKVRVSAIVDGKAVSQTIANQHRPDLQDKGIGDGCYGYALKLPTVLMDGHEHTVAVLLECTDTIFIGERKALLPQLAFEPISPDHENYQFEVAVCAIAKNECSFIAEWIAYHRIIGITKFVIFDNESSDSTTEILTKLHDAGVVEHVLWPSPPNEAPQKPAYAEGLLRLEGVAQWIAFIDIDEFIHPLINDSLPQLLSEYETAAGLVLPWRIFGSSGEERAHDELVVKRFVRRAEDEDPVNHAVKCIVQSRALEKVAIHTPELKFGQLVDENFKVVGSDGDPDRHAVPSASKIILNHYFCKSRDEWEQKRLRGRATRRKSDASFLRSDEIFHQHDKNTVVDRRILRFESRLRRELRRLSLLL